MASLETVDDTREIPVAPVRRSRRRWLVAGTVVLLAAGAGIGVWLGTSGSSGPALAVSTRTVTVATGTMKQTVSTSGTIAPADQASLDFAVSGKVTAVEVSTGQAVSVGQVLATVDPSALQATVDAAQASLTAAQARLSSDQSAGASASQIDSDQASVTSAQSQLTSAQTDLADASLTSTIAGTVASVDLAVGQQVSSAGGGTSGIATAATTSASSSSSAQVVVVSTDSYVVSATVDDTQVGEVAKGNQVTITPSGSTTVVYGTVSSVGLIASSTSGVATFPVEIDVTGTPSGLYAGTTATLSIIVKELTDVVQVPTAAISYAGGKATVTVVSDGRHRSQPVTTGQVSTGETQITAGLRAGDKVIERVVTFNGATAGGGRSLLGGGSSGGGSFPAGGGFPGRGGLSGGGSFGG